MFHWSLSCDRIEALLEQKTREEDLKQQEWKRTAICKAHDNRRMRATLDQIQKDCELASSEYSPKSVVLPVRYHLAMHCIYLSHWISLQVETYFCWAKWSRSCQFPRLPHFLLVLGWSLSLAFRNFKSWILLQLIWLLDHSYPTHLWEECTIVGTQ